MKTETIEKGFETEIEAGVAEMLHEAIKIEPRENERAVEALAAWGEIDDAIHQKARLGIISALLALGEADFRLLRETLSLSDGNLSTHLALLEERGYVSVKKEFIRRKPRTTYTPTDAGRAAFQHYLATLERILRVTETPFQGSQNSQTLHSLEKSEREVR